MTGTRDELDLNTLHELLARARARRRIAIGALVAVGVVFTLILSVGAIAIWWPENGWVAVGLLSAAWSLREGAARLVERLDDERLALPDMDALGAAAPNTRENDR